MLAFAPPVAEIIGAGLVGAFDFGDVAATLPHDPFQDGPFSHFHEHAKRRFCSPSPLPFPPLVDTSFWVGNSEIGPEIGDKGCAIGIKTADTANTIISRGENWLGRKD